MRSRPNARPRTHWPLLIPILALVLALALVGVRGGSAGATDPPAEWLQNQGFEQGLDHWVATSPAENAVDTVGDESLLSIYATMKSDDVAPRGGEGMLRLGVPKGVDSHQVKGVESVVSEEFESDGRPVNLAYRIFTWDDRAGDNFVIEVNGTVLSEDGESTKPYHESYEQAPPTLKSKKEPYGDSGWVSLSIDIPKGTSFSISYTLTNDANAAHDTWVYVDHVNQPPVAQLSWAPDEPHEGDVVGLYGYQSYDPDGIVVKWQWKITNQDGDEVLYNKLNGFQSPAGFIVPPNGDDTYTVELTVWDNEGLPDTTEGEFVVQNVAPRVNALDVIEVLSGTQGQLVGRFVDPGWEDTHEATWTWQLQGETETGTSESLDLVPDEDHLAPVVSGFVGGLFDASGRAPGEVYDLSLSVSDIDGGVGSDPDGFKIPADQLEEVRVIAPDPLLREDPEQDDPDVFPATVELEGDGAYLSYLQSQGDVDIFEIRLPDGGPIPMGTEVLATLRGATLADDLPADYDLIVFEGVVGLGEEGVELTQEAPFVKSRFQPAAFMHSGFMHSAFMHSAFMNSGFMNSGFMHSPFDDAGFMHSAFMNSGFMNSAFMHSPFADAGFMHSGFMHSAFMHSAFMHSGFMNSGFMNSGFMHSPLDGYPLSSMSFTGTERDNTSGTDISYDELGFDLAALDQGQVEDLRVLGFSANSGKDPEVVLATAGYPQTGDGPQGRVYVAVKSAAGAYSDSSPYTLQIETSAPLDPLAVDLDEQDPLVTSPGEEPPLTYERGDALTLFVTQFERLESLYGSAGRDLVEAKLKEVAVRDDVRGMIMSVPAELYADYSEGGDTGWDNKPWLVERANEVAQSIRAKIQEQLETHEGIEYVVLVGNDQVIPFRRLADQTIIGNEQNYTDQSFLTHPSATLASLANGYILTDDYYGDDAPISWGGSYVYIPDYAVSRLVETPGEIERTIDAFIDAEGVLSPDVGLVSGYDFMVDGAQNVRQIFSDAGLSPPDSPVDLIGETWTGDELRGELLGKNVDAANINAHFTHFAGLSPIGWQKSTNGESYDLSQLLLSSEIADAQDGQGGYLFDGKLVFSMGCHAGLSVPDKQVVALSPDSPIKPGLDFPQAMMKQGGVYLGSTGFGYGDTVGIAGTEALIGFFAEQLVGGPNMPRANSVGLALAQAKQDYLGSLSSVTPYDQKSSVQFTLYGMPQYHLADVVPEPTQVASATSASMAASGNTDDDGAFIGEFQLSLSERSMDMLAQGDENLGALPALFSQSYTLKQHQGHRDTDEGPEYLGEYITADGKAEATPDRPIHPVAPVDVDPSDDHGPAHGFVYTGGTYDIPRDFQPVIARPTTEWELDANEFQVATSEFWPVEPGSLTTRETTTAYGYDQAFVAVPAQFKPTAGTDPIEGTERVWSSLAAELLRSEALDWAAPTVRDLDLWLTAGQLVVSVDAYDDNGDGISRIVALQMGPNEMYVPIGGDHYFGGTPNGDGGRYELTIDLAGIDPTKISLLVQVVDSSGNVTTLTGKGATISLKPGLRNPGFEQGLRYWDVTQPVLDNASPVPTPSDDLDPTTFDWMLQLGTPTDTDAHQVKGITSVSQQFIFDEDISVVFLPQTADTRDWEFDDVFTISVTDESAGVTNVWVDIRNTDVTPGGSDWGSVLIEGLEAGTLYTLTYTLDTTNSAAKNTWVHIDQGD